CSPCIQARDQHAAKLATTEGIRILGSRIAAVKFRDGIEQPSNHKGRGFKEASTSRKQSRCLTHPHTPNLTIAYRWETQRFAGVLRLTRLSPATEASYSTSRLRISGLPAIRRTLTTWQS